jgi:hypothetical protein
MSSHLYSIFFVRHWGEDARERERDGLAGFVNFLLTYTRKSFLHCTVGEARESAAKKILKIASMGNRRNRWGREVWRVENFGEKFFVFVKRKKAN